MGGRKGLEPFKAHGEGLKGAFQGPWGGAEGGLSITWGQIPPHIAVDV